MDKEPSQTTQRVTQKSQKSESSWTSGSHSTTQSQAKEESLIVNLQKNKLDVTVDETMTGISGKSLLRNNTQKQAVL